MCSFLAGTRYPVRVVMAACMVVCAGGNLMYTLADSKWFLLGARIVAGAGGAIDAVTYGYATRVVKHTNIARFLSGV
jgi:predicted MFS family arabinose efflux permease